MDFFTEDESFDEEIFGFDFEESKSKSSGKKIISNRKVSTPKKLMDKSINNNNNLDNSITSYQPQNNKVVWSRNANNNLTSLQRIIPLNDSGIQSNSLYTPGCASNIIIPETQSTINSSFNPNSLRNQYNSGLMPNYENNKLLWTKEQTFRLVQAYLNVKLFPNGNHDWNSIRLTADLIGFSIAQCQNKIKNLKKTQSLNDYF